MGLALMGFIIKRHNGSRFKWRGAVLRFQPPDKAAMLVVNTIQIFA